MPKSVLKQSTFLVFLFLYVCVYVKTDTSIKVEGIKDLEIPINSSCRFRF